MASERFDDLNDLLRRIQAARTPAAAGPGRHSPDLLDRIDHLAALPGGFSPWAAVPLALVGAAVILAAIVCHLGGGLEAAARRWAEGG